jgi:hypothetical protein
MAQQDNAAFVTVLETADSFALKLAKASLEDAGIPYVTVGDKQGGGLPGFQGTSGIGETPLWRCAVRIQVPARDEAEARELLEPLAHPDPEGGAEWER